MAPKRQFDLAKSLRPHTERPYSSVGSVEHVEDVEDEQHEQHAEHEEYAKDNWSPELDLHFNDKEHKERGSHDSWTGDVTPYEGIYGWYEIRNDEEADIEWYLRAPKAIPMVWKTESWKITRAEALRKFQPIAERFRASLGTADVKTQVRNIFTKDTIRALPPHEKRLLKMNAELHGVTDVCEWLQGEKEKEDLQEIYWEERHQVAHLSERSVEDVWADLYHLSENSTLYLASRLDLRITALKTIFDDMKRREKLGQQLRIANSAAKTGVDANVARSGKSPLDRGKTKRSKRSLAKAFVKRIFCRWWIDGLVKQ